jgi:flavin-binding protein dodecin
MSDSFLPGSAGGVVSNGSNGSGKVHAERNGHHAARVVEFSGSSNDTIADAVRVAMARASRSLRTLEGAGVRVIPQISRGSSTPRFQVTLHITRTSNGSAPQPTP